MNDALLKQTVCHLARQDEPEKKKAPWLCALIPSRSKRIPVIYPYFCLFVSLLQLTL